MSEKSVSKVAIVGCGIVGGGTALLLHRDKELITQKTGLEIDLKYIVDVNFDHAKAMGLPETLFERDYQKVLGDEEIETVVELVGGTTTAKDIIAEAFKAGKHVVTANKALLAHYGPELFALARKNGRTLSFEASCAGGIPVVRAICDGLMANRIDAFYGIVNGTCNFILTEMMEKGKPYADALTDAQKSGLAEADPTLDVSGMDSAHKLAILASLSFQQKVSLQDIPVIGIDTLELQDVIFGQELGYTIKLLAIAQRVKDSVRLSVRPAFIGKDHPLSWIAGPFNAVSIYGHAVGHTMHYGRGAGSSPTASAVAADIISIAAGTAPLLFNTLAIWPDKTAPARVLQPEEIQSRFYLRLNALDKPGVFAQIATALGNQGISISSVLQKEPAEDSGIPAEVPVVITTHMAREGNVEKALMEIDGLDSITKESICIPIVDEHEENL